MNCASSRANRPAINRAIRCTSATFEASVRRENMLSPKKAPFSDTP